MKFLDILSQAYYTGNPLVSNELFDELAKKYRYNEVGASYADAKVHHAYRMWSLSKVYPGDKVPFNEPSVRSPKLDGAAVEIFYVDGNVAWAATRGDGVKGQDITDKMRFLVPLNLGTTGRSFQVTGEVVTKKGKENLRNYASGALNLRDLEEFKTRDLYFFAYDLVPNVFDTYTETLEFLESVGFKTVRQATDEFPTDGEVVRVDSNVTFEQMGYTSKHPRGAYALKENKDGVRTVLRDIIWDVGRSGVVTPVAIFDPVDVDGAIVARATLHNWKYIQDLDLEKDCVIEVIRAGDIIPRVIGRIYD